MKRKVSSSMILNLLFIVGTLALAWGTWNAYFDWKRTPLTADDDSMDAVSAMLPQELRMMLADASPATSEYGIVTEKNLFSPNRRAWAPPPQVAEDASQGENQAQALTPEALGIRLYGTTIGLGQKTALLYFERFVSKQKHRILGEGETARDEGERGESVYFILKGLEQDAVVLEDAQGREHPIGLYEHPRTEPVAAPGPRQGAGMNGPAFAPVPGDGNEPILRMEDIPESLEERERLAAEGRLRRISTPAGPVFRPVE